MFLLLFTSAAFYSLGRPNFFFFSGIPSSVRFLAPLLEIVGLSLFYCLLNQSRHLRERLIFTYFFILSSSFLVFNGYWYGIERLTGLGSFLTTLSFFILPLLLYPQLVGLALLFPYLKKQKKSFVFFFFAAFAILEWFVPGLDTIQTGQTWIEWAPHLRWAPLIGMPLYIFFNYEISWLLFSSTKKMIPLTLLFLFSLSNLNFKESEEKGPEIALIQTNHAPYSILRAKNDKEAAIAIIKTSVEKNIHKIVGHPQLVIFPETTWPFPLDKQQSVLSQMKETFPEINHLVERGIHLGIGGPLIGEHDHFERYYNSFFLLSREGKDQIYSKRNLMPLAESPFSLIGESLTAALMKRRDFTVSGESIEPLVLPTGETFQVDICFDGDAQAKLRTKLIEANRKSDFIVNVANDYWFNPSSQAYGHLWRSRWGSVLFSIPMARATNDGISAFIGWDGVVDRQLPAGESGHLQSKLRFAKNRATLFLDFGLLPFCLFTLIIGLGIFIYEKRYQNK